LAMVLLLGLAWLAKHDHRREIVIGLLSLVWGFNVLGVGVLVASPLSHTGSQITGKQLLLSGGVVLFADAVAFGARLLGARLRGACRSSHVDGAPKARLSVSAGREPRTGARQLVTSPLGLPLCLADEFDCVQPHGRNAAHACRQAADGGGVDAVGDHRA